MIQVVEAGEVCVVVDYGSVDDKKPDGDCVDIDDGKNGYELLNEFGWDLTWGADSAFGHMLCQIEGVGEEVDDSSPSDGKYCKWNVDYDESYWALTVAQDGDWVYQADKSFDGNPHYETKDGDVVGLAFGKFPSKPDMFKINASKVYVDGDKQKDSKTRGGKIVDVFPGSKVEVKIELESFYDSDTNIEITDITIEAAIEEIEDGDDIEADINEFDLSADREITKELEFTIPLEVDEKDRLLKIEIEAEDDAGIRYEEEITFDVEIDKESHALRIMDASLNKDSYSCGENALISVSVLNIGSNEEDVRLRMFNDDLGLDVTKSFELSNDAFEDSIRYMDRFSLSVPLDAEEGSYPISIAFEYGTDEEKTSVDLNVAGCTPFDVEEVKESTVTEQVKADAIDTEIGTESEKKDTGEATITSEVVDRDFGMMLGVILGILVIVIIGLLVMFWIFRK